MLKTKIKNIILLVTVLICIYLSSNVWLQLPEFLKVNLKEEKDSEVIIEADIWKVLRPIKNILKYEENYTVLYSDQEGLWEKALVAINDAFANFSDSSITESVVFPSQYIKFDFN